ncbi:1-acyl-sn-glycerol-3-phosphate acyltransferase, partial [Streptomyces sp. TRM76130]|nr:1-acyl-sn-glycerol-3-phosphate acyltransferase [Streptomyces sp. TRM76130]
MSSPAQTDTACPDVHVTPTPEGPLSRFALIKAVLGPIMRLMFRPQVEGAENIPGDGPVILAG